MTLRQLVGQSSGIDNGPYTDFGDGDAAVAAYVSALGSVEQVAPPGERYGYSNAAFVLAGLLVERHTGMTWDQALVERVLSPAGLRESVTDPADAILRPVAIGHVADGAGGLAPVNSWGVCGRAMGPTGSSLCATAADVARFGAIHAGHDPGGVLDPGSASVMHARHVLMPEGSTIALGNALCWWYDEWDGVVSLGHPGGNHGAGSFLRVVPELDLSIAVVFNSDNAGIMQRRAIQWVLADHFDVAQPNPWLPVDEDAVAAIDLARYVGSYSRLGLKARVEVAPDGHELVFADAVQDGYRLDGLRLRPVTSRHFASTLATAPGLGVPEGSLYPDWTFDGFDDGGRPQYLYTRFFLARRTKETPI